MRDFILPAALALAAIGFAASSSAQQQQPTPPTVTIRPPVVVTPNATVRTGQIPVLVQWREGGERVDGRLPPSASQRIVTNFPEADHDGDGIRNLVAGGSDCDDDNAARSSHRLEVVDHAGLDEDCNFLTIGVQDNDRDGYVSWRAMNIVYNEARQPVAVIRGPDCDDDRSDTHPGSVEVPGDRRDNDCDGAIDVVSAPGHGNYYCPPTESVAVAANGRVTPCGAPGGAR